MRVNVWIAISDQAKAAIVNYLQTDELGPLTEDEGKLFSYMQDRASRLKMFKEPTFGPRTYQLWSVDFDGDQVPLGRVRQTLDGLITKYPNQIAVLGAWDIDTGAQVTNAQDEVIYPLHPQLSAFMPDDPDGTPNPTLRDVNILYGQAPREFS